MTGVEWFVLPGFKTIAVTTDGFNGTISEDIPSDQEGLSEGIVSDQEGKSDETGSDAQISSDETSSAAFLSSLSITTPRRQLHTLPRGCVIS